MNLYLLGMIFFLLVFIVSIFLLIYFIKDEKSLKEVTNQELIKLGKIYTKEEFENKINDNTFLEYASYNDNYYGTPKDKVEEKLNEGKDVILVIDINGAINIKKIIPSALFIFIMPPDMETLKNRLIGRKTESKDKVVQRFITAYNEVNNYKKYNYVVVNDKVEDAVNKVKSIIQSEKCRVDRIEDIYLGNKEELIHEILIDKNFENNYWQLNDHSYIIK